MSTKRQRPPVYVLPRRDGKWEVRTMAEPVYALWCYWWHTDRRMGPNREEFTRWMKRKGQSLLK